jgi:hypothetical protein
LKKREYERSMNGTVKKIEGAKGTVKNREDDGSSEEEEDEGKTVKKSYELSSEELSR